MSSEPWGLQNSLNHVIVFRIRILNGDSWWYFTLIKVWLRIYCQSMDSLSSQIPQGISSLNAHIWTPSINWTGIKGKSFSESVGLNGVSCVFGAPQLNYNVRWRSFLFRSLIWCQTVSRDRVRGIQSHPHTKQTGLQNNSLAFSEVSFWNKITTFTKTNKKSNAHSCKTRRHSESINLRQHSILQFTVLPEHIITMASIWSWIDFLTLQTSLWELESSLYLH